MRSFLKTIFYMKKFYISIKIIIIIIIIKVASVGFTSVNDCYINKNKTSGELSCENMISPHVKRSPRVVGRSRGCG